MFVGMIIARFYLGSVIQIRRGSFRLPYSKEANTNLLDNPLAL